MDSTPRKKSPDMSEPDLYDFMRSRNIKDDIIRTLIEEKLPIKVIGGLYLVYGIVVGCTLGLIVMDLYKLQT